MYMNLKSLIILSLVKWHWEEVWGWIISSKYMEPHFSKRITKIWKNKFKIFEKYWGKEDKLIEHYRYFYFDGKESEELSKEIIKINI